MRVDHYGRKGQRLGCVEVGTLLEGEIEGLGGQELPGERMFGPKGLPFQDPCTYWWETPFPAGSQTACRHRNNNLNEQSRQKRMAIKSVYQGNYPAQREMAEIKSIIGIISSPLASIQHLLSRNPCFSPGALLF